MPDDIIAEFVELHSKLVELVRSPSFRLVCKPILPNLVRIEELRKQYEYENP